MGRPLICIKLFKVICKVLYQMRIKWNLRSKKLTCILIETNNSGYALSFTNDPLSYELIDTRYSRCRGKGDVIGMLKVGRKHLFLFDEQNQVHEVQPLCVLDFFVLRDRQRMGYGRRLFDWMLHVSTFPLFSSSRASKHQRLELLLANVNYAVNYLSYGQHSSVPWIIILRPVKRWPNVVTTALYR